MKSSEIAPFGAGGGAPLLAEDSLACQEGRPHSSVDRNLDGAKFHQWKDSDNPWTHEDETDNGIKFQGSGSEYFFNVFFLHYFRGDDLREFAP